MFINNHYDLFIEITNHTFQRGDPISIVSGDYVLSSAIDDESSNFIGIVCRVTTNGIYIRSFGSLNVFNGLTPGAVYYLSDTAGEYDVTPGTITVPMFIAITPRDAVFYQKTVISDSDNNLFVEGSITNKGIVQFAEHGESTGLEALQSDDPRIPTQDQKDALVGVGTPSETNRYITEDSLDIIDGGFF